jgi:MerR family redox-sensitive transcriptional activator SoxR
MRIGDVASRAGVSVRSLRYYEEQGLVRADRSESGQRVYPASVVGRVRLIQQFYAAGLPSRAIALILPSVDSGVTTPETVDILLAERRRIATTVADLTAILGQLDTVIQYATESSQHPAASHCARAD